jgi:hypothetical protein
VERVNIYTGFGQPPGSAFSYSPAQSLPDSVTSGVSTNGTVFDKFVLGRRSPYPKQA